MLTHFEFSRYKNHDRSEKYINLEDAISSLYAYLCHNLNADITCTKITVYYMNIETTHFDVEYSNGIILKNDNNKIKVSVLYPHFSVLDSIINNNYNGAPLQHQPLRQHQNNKQSRHIKLLSRGNNMHNKSNATNIINETNETNITNEDPKEIDIIMKTNRNDETLDIFKSDKIAYTKIKNDISEGKLKRNQIHPNFIIKYQLFQILELRNVINFDSDENIQKEYEIFSVLNDECHEEKEIIPDKTNNIWIPPNYHYMSESDKIKYAQRYEMTVPEFENKFVNTIDTPSLPETPIVTDAPIISSMF